MACLLAAGSAWCKTQTVRVVGITDGDTVKVIDAERHEIKVRLASIDAPEKNQAFGQRSKQSLSELVFGADLAIDCRKKLSYDRQVCVVYRDGADVNLEQIRRWIVWWSRKYAYEQSAEQRDTYETAGRPTQERRRGLWSDPEPVPQWEFREK